MCLFDDVVRQKWQKSGGGGSNRFRVTDNAQDLMFDFARSKQRNVVDGEDMDKIKAFVEKCMDNALHGRSKECVSMMMAPGNDDGCDDLCSSSSNNNNGRRKRERAGG